MFELTQAFHYCGSILAPARWLVLDILSEGVLLESEELVKELKHTFNEVGFNIGNDLAFLEISYE